MPGAVVSMVKHEGWQVYVGGVYGAASKDTG